MRRRQIGSIGDSSGEVSSSGFEMRTPVTPALDLSPPAGGTSPLPMGVVTTPTGEGLENAVESDGEGVQIAAVDAAVVELACEVAK
jgi:hypothetical protein